MSVGAERRVVSGMRPTGALHIGHYLGVLKNWVDLQYEYDCFYFVADWHALTTHYEDQRDLEPLVTSLVVDWLACGVNPNTCTLFVQSHVPEHAELHLLLSMITPLSWLERVPTYKDQIEKLKERDLATYGFLGYPLLQSADVLMYQAGHVPVGADQVAHIEITREIARRFNHVFGREPDFESAVEQAIAKMGKKNAKLYNRLRTAWQEQGDESSLETAKALVRDQQNIRISDKERLLGSLDGSGKLILAEPQALLTRDCKLPGLDGQKMSKSYGNTIPLRAAPEEVDGLIRRMQTDPARVKRTDPGNPDLCPVWQFHQVYSNDDTRAWVMEGCKNAGIGCLECKQPIINAVQAELEPIQTKIREYENDIDTVRSILLEGAEKAREVAQETLDDVRSAMGLGYHR